MGWTEVLPDLADKGWVSGDFFFLASFIVVVSWTLLQVPQHAECNCSLVHVDSLQSVGVSDSYSCRMGLTELIFHLLPASQISVAVLLDSFLTARTEKTQEIQVSCLHAPLYLILYCNKISSANGEIR